MRAVFGGAKTGPNPTDRAKLGSKRHLICDGRGLPLAIQLTGANCNDSQQVTLIGRRHPNLDCVLADRGYDAEPIRQGLRGRHVVPSLAKRNTEHGSGLGRLQWG